MPNIVEKDGIIVLESEFFDLKIDNNRKVYVKKKDENTYKGIDEEVEYGMSSQEKKKYLYELYQLIHNKMQQRSQLRNQNNKQALEEQRK